MQREALMKEITLKATVAQVRGQFDMQKEKVAHRFRNFSETPRFYTQTYNFSTPIGEWDVIPYKQLNKKFKGHFLTSLSVLTYNIWFNEDDNFDGMCIIIGIHMSLGINGCL